jgi:archaellum component FlaF (FlaF/FlaG flagellin family)
LKQLIDFQNEWEILAEKGMADYSALTSDERVWFNCHSLMEQADSGIISFYYNESADHVNDTIEDLGKIKFNEPVELLKKINSLFPGGIVPDIEKRNEIINSWDSEEYNVMFEEIDDKFYAFKKQFAVKILDFIMDIGLAYSK